MSIFVMLLRRVLQLINLSAPVRVTMHSRPAKINRGNDGSSSTKEARGLSNGNGHVVVEQQGRQGNGGVDGERNGLASDLDVVEGLEVTLGDVVDRCPSLRGPDAWYTPTSWLSR